jgi:glutamate racemase
MDDRPIAFFDSGVGGLPYLALARDRLPSEDFRYLADRANFPYGTKGHDELLGLILRAVDRFVALVDPKLVVIACNTASVVALEALRNCHPDLPFIGTVPAIKPAAERSSARRIGILATRRTVGDPYSQMLVDKFARDCEVTKIAGSDIVEFVEHRYFGSGAEERMAVVAEAIEAFKEAGVDQVVLGCTHFLYLRPEIEAMLGPGVGLVDSREGVVSRLVSVLTERDAYRAPGSAGSGRFYLSGREPFGPDHEGFAAMFGLKLGGLV